MLTSFNYSCPNNFKYPNHLCLRYRKRFVWKFLGCYASCAYGTHTLYMFIQQKCNIHNRISKHKSRPMVFLPLLWYLIMTQDRYKHQELSKIKFLKIYSLRWKNSVYPQVNLSQFAQDQIKQTVINRNPEINISTLTLPYLYKTDQFSNRKGKCTTGCYLGSLK